MWVSHTRARKADRWAGPDQCEQGKTGGRRTGERCKGWLRRPSEKGGLSLRDFAVKRGLGSHFLAVCLTGLVWFVMFCSLLFFSFFSSSKTSDSRSIVLIHPLARTWRTVENQCSRRG
ncbi:hypothetical protein LX32DRAFT_144805 [Colletotrichum zoysiae]|uniref:Transmembrane protein n=1 Tax=Colletotrichum zoysiae TaxID=1216348 RepID=A0AAD9LYY2_9PEZI|nr:hypothetical protein LX32DRAFT_144805 [Colletotrichum zoysiae]